MPFLRFSLLFSFAFFVSFSAAHADRCGDIAARIAATFEKNDSSIPAGRFPKAIPVLVNEKTAREALAASLRMWNEEFHPKKTKKLLNEIIESDGDPDFRKKQIKFLKNQRKKAVLIRSMIHTFGKPNSETNFFDEFVKDLGKLNDGLEKGDEKFTKKRAKTLLENLPEVREQDLENEVSRVTARTVIARLTKERDSLLSKLNKKQIEAESYHDIRKEMRDFLHVLRVLNAVSPSPQMKRAFRHAEAISDKLDKTHRKVALETLGDKEEYEDETIELDKRLASQIRQFLNALEFE